MSSISIELRDKLEELIESAINIQAYYLEAPDEAKYPYCVYEVRRTQSNGSIDGMNLIVDIWDQYKTWSRVEVFADSLEEKLDYELTRSESFVFASFKGGRRKVEDSDKTIKRMQTEFTINFVERKK